MNIYGVHVAGAGGGEVWCSPIIVTEPHRVALALGALSRFLAGTHGVVRWRWTDDRQLSDLMRQSPVVLMAEMTSFFL